MLLDLGPLVTTAICTRKIVASSAAELLSNDIVLLIYSPLWAARYISRLLNSDANRCGLGSFILMAWLLCFAGCESSQCEGIE